LGGELGWGVSWAGGELGSGERVQGGMRLEVSRLGMTGARGSGRTVTDAHGDGRQGSGGALESEESADWVVPG
jgi:hypothetical protein